jgi:hypothetical protein
MMLLTVGTKAVGDAVGACEGAKVSPGTVGLAVLGDVVGVDVVGDAVGEGVGDTVVGDHVWPK